MSNSVKRKLKKAIEYGNRWIKHRFDVAILYADWLFVTNKKMHKELSNHTLGKCRIVPINPRKWHNGTSVFCAIDIYDNRYFIKRSLNCNAISAEAEFVLKLKDISDNIETKVCRLYFMSEDKTFLVEEYINARPLSDKQFLASMSHKDKIVLLNTLYNTVCELHSRGIIHADFTPKNILVSEEEGVIFLIDFEYSLLEKDVIHENYKKISKDRLMNLGADYSMKNGILDDGYSLMVISKYLIPDLLSSDYDLWKKINLSIGRLQFDLENGHFIEN